MFKGQVGYYFSKKASNFFTFHIAYCILNIGDKKLINFNFFLVLFWILIHSKPFSPQSTLIIFMKYLKLHGSQDQIYVQPKIISILGYDLNHIWFYPKMVLVVDRPIRLKLVCMIDITVLQLLSKISCLKHY